jgi:pimeloyl-ACP methyl ester carboxylesterase
LQAAQLGEDDPPARDDAPAVLLVHGFGAFGEQWRGQVQALTRAGYQVCFAQQHLSSHPV